MKKPRDSSTGWSTGVMVAPPVKGLVAGLDDGVLEQDTSGKDTSTAVKSRQTEVSDDFLCLQPMN
jgi:hypothetical protein